MRKMIKNKRGVTLIEMIIGGLLFTMVVMTVSAVLSPLMSTFRRANDFAEFNQIVDGIGNRITSEMAQSDIVDSATGTNIVTMKRGSATIVLDIDGVDSGILRRRLTESLSDPGVEYPVFPTDFYRGKTVSFEVIVPTGATPDYTVNVTVQADGRISSAAVVRSYVVRPLLMTDDPQAPAQPTPPPTPDPGDG